ncbi:hypothetical protein NQZ68_021678 [Dissostichus eleginoides]|nr:hypothetical protein NQZ68_021678 [Dissostichus eleginoides]
MLKEFNKALVNLLTVLSSPAAIFVIVRSHNGLAPLSQSEERGGDSPQTDNAGIITPLWV